MNPSGQENKSENTMQERRDVTGQEKKELSEIETTDEIDLLDLFLVLVKRKKLILGLTTTVVILTIIISLILPPIYRAETKVLIIASESPSSSLIGLFSDITALTGSSAFPTKADLYAELFKSNTVLDRIIQRFNLKKLYDKETLTDTRKILLSKLDVKVDKKTGIITLSFEDKDPKRAAEIANAFVEELKNLNKNLALSIASKKRLFFEEQLNDAKQALTKAEEELKRFQQKTGVINLEEQAKAVIGSIAALKAQIAAKEAELRVLRTYATPQNPEVQKLEEAIRALRAQLASLEKNSGQSFDALVPVEKASDIGTEYLRKLRDFKYYEALYQTLLKSYEMAKMEEEKDVVLVQVIDPATPPEKKAKPKRKLMVVVAFTSSLFLSIFLAFIAEYIESISLDPERKNKLEEIRKYLRFNFSFRSK